jgi:hypothetical protein
VGEGVAEAMDVEGHAGGPGPARDHLDDAPLFEVGPAADPQPRGGGPRVGRPDPEVAVKLAGGLGVEGDQALITERRGTGFAARRRRTRC